MALGRYFLEKVVIGCTTELVHASRSVLVFVVLSSTSESRLKGPQKTLEQILPSNAVVATLLMNQDSVHRRVFAISLEQNLAPSVTSAVLTTPGT